ncbi:MAG: SBBP repeat-containing protein [Acidobacteriia bacterium]|nr:SBBP repeat-containing protein [Terriglobia bacterium]
MEISLLRGSPAPLVEPLDRLPARTDYYIGRRTDWLTGVAQYAKIAYRSVYPGIDVVYYGNQSRLEYDFVLRPGADARRIRLQFRGADHVSLNSDGDLVVESGGAQFIQQKPVLYQEDALTFERHPIEGRYRLLPGSVVALDVSSYDRSQPLVIDPVVTYASFLGGSATDQINAVTTDGNGYIYVAGYSDSNDLQPTYNGVKGANAGDNDAFIAIFDPKAFGGPSLRYLTYLGGSNNDAATAITVDSGGNLYITGTTSSMDFPLPGNSVQTSLALSTSETVFNPNIFVSVISQSNGLVYSTYFGGTGGDFPYGIGLDAKGNIYVGGTTQSTDLPVTPNAYAAVLWGGSDVFVLELNINATSPLYASYIGGEDRDDGRGFAVRSDGKVYIAASTLSTLFPIAGRAYQNSPSGIENLVVVVMDLTQSGNLSLVYSSYLGGSNIEEVRQLALDASGNVLITGWTLSSDFPVTSNAMQLKYGGSGNAFVTRVNPSAPPSGFIQYSTFLGGSGGDVGYGITSDSAGNYYVAGYTLSSDFPVTRDAAQNQLSGGIEAFLVKFNPAVAGRGALEYGTYFGSGGFHVATGVAVAPDGTMMIGGYTTDALSGVGQAIASAYQGGFAGGYADSFVAALK